MWTEVKKKTLSRPYKKILSIITNIMNNICHVLMFKSIHTNMQFVFVDHSINSDPHF